ncbi:hypothetical protein PIN31115_00119 [Pandoraea iniqua]|uniref:Zinc ribbon domain-containing protein n=1 Tax=Pandoraea iniqua TaxID=2508288 RepID=A0A5E4RDZ3_9BURK|nr:hypothetical protein [Pandoraea iniqua]VVD61510.1 hypothetical protein PIN31115_00119 [Pandoraea iniqua]
MQCPTCGTNNATSALRCKQCGAPLADAEPGFREAGLASTAAGVLSASDVAAIADAADAADVPKAAASMGETSASASASAPANDAVPPTPTRRLTRRERREQRRRDGEPGWINGVLVLGTAVFAAIALIGIWWNLRAPYVDPSPKPDAIVVAPFNNGSNAPPVNASGGVSVGTPSAASSAESALLARAQVLAAVDAAASGAEADVASAAASTPPMTASAATAALTAAATAALTPPAPAPDDMMTLLSRRDAANATNTARPVPNPDLPAHLDNNDIGPIAAAGAAHPPAVASSPATASAAGAATTIAAALAQCDKYRWFEVVPKQRCIWAVCSGRWGRDGCPAGVNPGESH